MTEDTYAPVILGHGGEGNVKVSRLSVGITSLNAAWRVSHDRVTG